MISTAALGNILAWSLQAVVVVGAASLLPWLLRLDAAGVRYVYWRVVALLCLALPWIQPYQGLQPGARAAVVNVVDAVVGAGGSGADAAPHIDYGGGADMCN